LQQDFLFRQIHPFDPPNKTIVQAVDRDGALRIEIFRSCGEVITRSANVNLWGLGAAYLIGGLVARSARLSLEVTRGVPTPRKHTADFLRLAKLLVHERLIETAWQTHRRPVDPATFRLANTLLQASIPASQELLITPVYSTDPGAICGRCQETSAFRLTPPETILSVMGYC
jgi:hypothetical protein